MKKSREKPYNIPRLELGPLGRRIRELRGFYMSQSDFAKRIGVTQSHLSALERGIKEPGASVLFAISRHSGKSVDWLLTGEAHMEKKSR